MKLKGKDCGAHDIVAEKPIFRPLLGANKQLRSQSKPRGCSFEGVASFIKPEIIKSQLVICNARAIKRNIQIAM